MSRAGRTWAVLAVLAAVIVLAGSAALTEPAGESAAGDRELLEDITREERLITERETSLAAYLGHLYRTLMDRIIRRVGDSELARAVSRVVVWVVAAAAIAALAWVVFVLVRSRAGPVRARRAPDDSYVEPLARDEENPADAYHRALEHGTPREALAALWAWVAARLVDEGRTEVREGATHREIVREVRLRDAQWEQLDSLAQLSRRSERWLFAGDGFDRDDVRGCRELFGGWLS